MEEKNIFWTPCAAHCINLMCQDISRLSYVSEAVKESMYISKFIYNHANVLHTMRKFTNKRNIVRPAVTRFATSFLSMDSIYGLKNSLRNMIHSEDWSRLKAVKSEEGKKVTKIIRRSTFWNKLHFALKVLALLVDVIRLVDAEERPCMGYIYYAVEDCKKKIEANIGTNERTKYSELLRIIEHRWAEQLHQPLHAAGFYLNPSIYFNEEKHTIPIESNSEIKSGMFKAISTLVTNEEEHERIIDQLLVYRTAGGMMGMPIAV